MTKCQNPQSSKAARAEQLFRQHAQNFFPGIKNIPDLKQAVMRANLTHVPVSPTTLSKASEMLILARRKPEIIDIAEIYRRHNSRVVDTTK